MMKKITKKATTILIVSCAALVLAVPAFASTGTSSNVSISATGPTGGVKIVNVSGSVQGTGGSLTSSQKIEGNMSVYVGGVLKTTVQLRNGIDNPGLLNSTFSASVGQTVQANLTGWILENFSAVYYTSDSDSLAL
ncbi:hypothetical protein [Paenibacillus sp. P36]|uniref:hypothetical protein n=1 Tax=Paenibacillus sp. P36 TaxID=3342538 RepID=UPI0038B3A743